MKEKIIYVDFKTASRKTASRKISHKKINTDLLKNKDSYIKKIAKRISTIFNKLFKTQTTYNEPLKYKHWL